jgi:hypothetical protein
MIWKCASLHPRIVHLSEKRLAADDDADWWKRVRSDKLVAGLSSCPEDDNDSEYGFFELDQEDIDRLEQQMAAKRLLTRDDNYEGGMSRAYAKDVLRSGIGQYSRPLFPGLNCPDSLYGLRSESPVPGVLLACRESFSVGSRIYSRSFGALGARPCTWFNPRRDTLYLDHLTKSNPYAFPGLPNLMGVLEGLFAPDELARIERLAIHRGPPGSYSWSDDGDRDEYSLFYFFRKLHKLFPNVEHLTIVDGHYAHQDRTIIRWDRSGEQYVNLKFMKCAFDSEFCWRVNGFRIDAALLHGGIHPQKGRIKEQLETAQKYWDNPKEGASWKLPQTDIEVIVSSSDEERLLHDAYLFEKEHNKGCWYINPLDSTDCDYYAGDEIDEGIEGLL